MSKNIYKIDSKVVKALLFDFDGTLVNTEIHQFKSFERLFNELGVKYIGYEEHIKRHAGKSFNAIYSETLGDITEEEIEKLREKRREYYFDLMNVNGVQVTKGLIPLLHDAHAKGLKLAIVTGSSSKTMGEILESSQIPDIFHLKVNAEDYENPKPHPEPYLKAVESFGIVPKSCIVFEDSLNGVKSAIDAGIDYYALLTTLPEIHFNEVDPNAKLIKDFTQLRII